MEKRPPIAHRNEAKGQERAAATLPAPCSRTRIERTPNRSESPAEFRPLHSADQQRRRHAVEPTEQQEEGVGFRRSSGSFPSRPDGSRPEPRAARERSSANPPPPAPSAVATDATGGRDDEFDRLVERIAEDDRTLTEVYLGSKHVGDEGAKKIAEALRTNTTVTKLNLWGNRIGLEGATALAEVMKNNATLTVLDLGGNMISDEGAKALAEAEVMRRNATLTWLSLWGNEIGNEGATALAEVLRHTATLTTLRLGDNEIGKEGATALAEALRHNATLTMIYLEKNNIGDWGAKALAEVLRHNATLAELDLGGNKIGKDGAKALAEGLRHNASLTVLLLGSNKIIGKEGATALAEALRHNATLTMLELRNNKFGDEVTAKIQKLIKINREAPSPQEAHRRKVAQFGPPPSSHASDQEWQSAQVSGKAHAGTGGGLARPAGQERSRARGEQERCDRELAEKSQRERQWQESIGRLSGGMSSTLPNAAASSMRADRPVAKPAPTPTPATPAVVLPLHMAALPQGGTSRLATANPPQAFEVGRTSEMTARAPPTEWPRPRCTLLNPIHQGSCEACGHQHEVDDTSSGANQTATAKREGPDNDDDIEFGQPPSGRGLDQRWQPSQASGKARAGTGGGLQEQTLARSEQERRDRKSAKKIRRKEEEATTGAAGVAALPDADASTPMAPLLESQEKRRHQDEGMLESGGREVMRRALSSITKPLPLRLEYLENCTNNFSGDQKKGEGSYGEVYLGTDKVLRRKFIVKRLKMSILEQGNEEVVLQLKKTFQRELETLSRFNRHYNIARLYAYSFPDSLRASPCLVFEYAAKGSLKDVLNNDAKRRTLHWTTRIQIAHDISRAVRYLHQGNGRHVCFHRDINPANVCLRRDCTALLIDCGLSTLEPANDSSMTLSIMHTSGARIWGTRGYICPDYVAKYFSGENPKYESANDVFSLGVVFVDLFTGLLRQERQVNLFERNSADDAGRNLWAHADSCAGEWDEHICKEFAELAAACIMKNPVERPNICEIEERLASLSGSAKPWTTGERNSITFLFSDPLVYSQYGVLEAVPRLDRKREIEHLKKCIRRSEQAIQLSFHAATNARLRELASKRCGCLHISCHGLPFDTLMFEDGYGGSEFISFSNLASLFTHREPFKLVFVASCHSETIGQAFINAGVKHAICCEHESKLSDDAAAAFTSSFYKDLAAGYTVQHSFESGKKAAPDTKQGKFLLLPEDKHKLPEDKGHDVVVFSKDKLEWEEDRETRQKIMSAPSEFIGRQREMYQVISVLLGGEKRLVMIVGEKGIGKSALARAVCEYIWARLDDSLLFDDIFYVDGNSRTGDEANEENVFLHLLHKQLREVGLTDDASQQTLFDRVCNALVGTKVILVFDGFDNQKVSVKQFLAYLFDRVKSVSVLLTANSSSEFRSVAVVESLVCVKGLDTESAANLFALSCSHADKKAELSEGLCNAVRGGGSHEVLETVRGGIPLRIIEEAEAMTGENCAALKQFCSSFSD